MGEETQALKAKIASLEQEIQDLRRYVQQEVRDVRQDLLRYVKLDGEKSREFDSILKDLRESMDSTADICEKEASNSFISERLHER